MRKTLVVTGGSKGIGKSIVLEFAKNGFDIITCSRKKQDLINLESEIKTVYPDIKFLYIDVDLSKKKDSIKFVEFVLNSTQSIDVLVNNVGTFIPGKLISEDESALKLMIDTNLYSNYWVTKGLIKVFTLQKSGHIFNICSIASKVAYDSGGSYCISKFALYGMSLCLREELKEFDVKVTSVLPGATRTGSWDGTSLPDDRFIKPEDVSSSIFVAYNTSKGANVEEITIRPQLGDI